MASSKPPQWSAAAGSGLVLALILATACGNADPAPRGESTGSWAAQANVAAGEDGNDEVQPEVRGSGRADPVRPGIDVLLSDSLRLVRGRRVGLITNQTGVGLDGTSTIDLLWEHPEVALVALFSPEHGIRGDAPEGETIEEEVDSATGLVVHSLYGATRSPTPEMLEGIEVLLFDMQDVGARYYTYVSTMTLAMEAAAREGVHFVVLDRPNPIDGLHVQGNILEPSFSSFIGMLPVAMRHGMTPGELARMARESRAPDLELTVVPAEGWRRSMAFEDTGLPWVPPSPNMPTVRTALHYPGTCLFEGTPLSVGRGTDHPFEQVGAPWLDGSELTRRLEARELPGVRFEAVRFTPRNPTDGKYPAEEVSGVRFVATGPDYDPTIAAVAALVEAHDMAGDRWEWRSDHFDLLAGTDRLRTRIEEGRSVEALTADWDVQLREFRQRREPYLIYEP